MLAYGILYALIHDGLVHRRFASVRSPRGGYLKRLVQAHRLHHAVRGRDGRGVVRLPLCAAGRAAAPRLREGAGRE